MIGELFGLPWKIKIDSYLDGIAIVDLKIMSSLTKLEWVRDIGYLDFVRYWGYDIQGAVYQEIVYQNTGKRLPFDKMKRLQISKLSMCRTIISGRP